MENFLCENHFDKLNSSNRQRTFKYSKFLLLFVSVLVNPIFQKIYFYLKSQVWYHIFVLRCSIIFLIPYICNFLFSFFFPCQITSVSYVKFKAYVLFPWLLLLSLLFDYFYFLWNRLHFFWYHMETRSLDPLVSNIFFF